MNKVLIIAMYFPPAGVVGSFRVAKYVKYLQQYNWKPVVITLLPEYYNKNVWLDNDSLDDIPKDTVIYRTKAMKIRIINNLGIRWIPYMSRVVLKAVKKEKPNMLFLTGSPFNPLIIAPFIKKLYKIPYIIDLRDPWRIKNIKPYKTKLKSISSKIIDSLCEPFVIKYASKIICVSDDMADGYRQYYHKYRTKFTVIQNGYDVEDFEKTPAKKLPANTIVYAGKFRTLEAYRNPSILFCAIKTLLDKGIELKFVHIGSIEKEVMDAARNAGIAHIVESIGPLPYKKTISYLKGSTLLVVIGSGIKWEQTAKIFDYLASKKPVLALVKSDSEIAAVAKKTSQVTIIDNTFSDRIAAVLEKLLTDQLTAPVPTLPYQFQLEYSRKSLAKKLSLLLNEYSLADN